MDRFYKKYIRIPPNESIDIREIMPIIHHPLFQRLLHISQLGTTLTVFPGASHNRFEHALGVYGKTKKFTRRMVEDGFLTPHEAKNVSLFGLLHDIGHGPFSHVIEELTPLSGDEDENGLVVLKYLKDEIKKSGGDYEFIRKIAAHKNPLYKIVMDKNVGMDKLDYLERDTYHTGFGQRPDIESLFNYLVYIKGKIVIDKKSLEAAKQMQRLYIYMYKEVYLHKSALISQRFIQKMMTHLMNIEKIDPKDLWRMNDGELMGLVYTSKDEALKFLGTSYKNRDLPSTGLVIRLKNREFKERIAGKNIKVVGEDKDFFEKLLGHAGPQDLEELEAKVAQILKVPAYKVAIVPTLTPWRFVPEDILYHDNGRILSLKDTQKEYFEALRYEMNDYMAVRVCIVGKRDVIYKNSAKIYQLIKKSV
jgi:HD superfamily phosphohydrolase